MCDTPQSQNTYRSHSPERAKDYRQGWSAAEPLQETRHNKKVPKGRRKNDVRHWLDGATHPRPKLFSYRNGWCDTPRPSILFTASQLERLMRHTPAFGHPSPRGDGAAAQHFLIIDN